MTELPKFAYNAIGCFDHNYWNLDGPLIESNLGDQVEIVAFGQKFLDLKFTLSPIMEAA